MEFSWSEIIDCSKSIIERLLSNYRRSLMSVLKSNTYLNDSGSFTLFIPPFAQQGSLFLVREVFQERVLKMAPKRSSKRSFTTPFKPPMKIEYVLTSASFYALLKIIFLVPEMLSNIKTLFQRRF